MIIPQYDQLPIVAMLITETNPTFAMTPYENGLVLICLPSLPEK